MNTTVNAELCPRCRASIALTLYTLPFEGDFAKAYCNPSSTDTSSIESSLSDSSAHLATLVKEIQRVESLLSALKTHHEYLENYIHRTTRLIQSSPIRRLPTEVLGIIFASACTSFQRAEYKTPLSISLVCSKWRDISISTPLLWTNIYVAPHSGAAGVPVYQHYLQRCGQNPISIKVEVPARIHPHPYDDDDDDDLSFEDVYEHHIDIMGEIYESFAQWRHAELYLKRADLEDLQKIARLWNYDMEQSEAPILSSLTLAMKDPNTTSIPSIFRATPSLTTVNLIAWGGNPYLFWNGNQLPWGRLRCIKTSQEDWANMMDPKNNFHDGESRTLILNGPSQRTITDFFLSIDPSFTYHLASLIINSEFWNLDVYNFFSDLAIPTLKNLSLICHDLDPIHDNPLDVLPEFLQSSQCELSTFSVVVHGGPGGTNTAQPTLADTLVKALFAMGHLKNLQVIEAPSGPPLLNKRLFEQLSADTFLPKLTSLELVWAEDRQPDSELLSALLSRADGRLSSVILGIRNGGNLDADVLECMRELRQKDVRATCW